MKILFIFLASLSLYASDSNIPALTLTASATISKPSDELQMKIGVVTLGSSAEEALQENNYKMQDVIANLLAIDLTDDDYETSHFSINPTYTPYPKDPPEHWKPSINGYEVTNTISVHTKKLDAAGKIIDAANQAGANSITDLRFGLHDTKNHWTEALSAAGANAVRDAQAIASATGVQLIRVLSINLNNTQVHAPQPAFMLKSASGGPTPPIEPGNVSLTANVTLVYEIQ